MPNYNTALLVIDVQQALFERSTKIYQAEKILENINTLIDSARSHGIPVVFIQHSNDQQLKYGSPGWQFHPQIKPHKTDLLIHKKHGNAFEETDLGEKLRAMRAKELVVCGLVTHGCVSATCVGAVALGYQVTLASDAHSNYSKSAKDIIAKAHEKLDALGVAIRTTQEIVN